MVKTVVKEEFVINIYLIQDSFLFTPGQEFIYNSLQRKTSSGHKKKKKKDMFLSQFSHNSDNTIN